MSNEKGIFEPQEGFAAPARSPFAVDAPPASPFAAAAPRSPFAVVGEEKPTRLTPEAEPFGGGYASKSPFEVEAAKPAASPFGVETPKPAASPFGVEAPRPAPSPFEVAAPAPQAEASPFGQPAPQPAPQPVVAEVRPEPPASKPVESNVRSIDPVQAAMAAASAAAAAPAPAPAPAPQPAPAPSPVAAAPAAADEGGSQESDSASIRQLELRAIFGVDRELSAIEILQRSRSLPGVRQLARVPAAEAGAVDAVKRLLGNLGFGTGQVKLYCGSSPIEFVREGNVLLAVQTDGGFAPGVRETLMIVARELSRM